MGSNPSHFKYVGLDAPVENISWNDAMEFCRRVSAAQTKTGEVPAGYAYRLPTEAEWEYACRAGTTGEFSGDGVVSDMGWYYDWDNGNADLRSHVVGEKMANGFGLYDMHGNVNEWCFDWYGPYSGGEVADPAGPGQERRRSGHPRAEAGRTCPRIWARPLATPLNRTIVSSTSGFVLPSLHACPDSNPGPGRQ